MATRRTVTKREAALMEARIAGYHDDSGRFTRAVIERRVSYAAMQAAWREGIAMRRAGIPCGCYSCKTAQDARSAGNHKGAELLRG